MDFLKDLIKINNDILLDNLIKKRILNKEESKVFIKYYDKHNNRLFVLCKRYNIDDYEQKIIRYGYCV